MQQKATPPFCSTGSKVLCKGWQQAGLYPCASCYEIRLNCRISKSYINWTLVTIATLLITMFNESGMTLSYCLLWYIHDKHLSKYIVQSLMESHYSIEWCSFTWLPRQPINKGYFWAMLLHGYISIVPTTSWATKITVVVIYHIFEIKAIIVMNAHVPASPSWWIKW